MWSTRIEGPRIAPSIDLPPLDRTTEVRQRPEPHPFGFSRYGVIPRERGSGLPTALPAGHLLAGEGFAVMSGCAHGVTPMQGSFIYPTRNFATLGIFVTRTHGTELEVRAFLPDSPCRHGDRTVPSLRTKWREHTGAWRAVSEDPVGASIPTVSC